jgi:hypothetical protein
MYEIGQKVVCVKAHSRGIVKEGEVHTVKGIKVLCGNRLAIDVGIMDNGSRAMTNRTPIGKMYVCSRCGKLHKFKGIAWLGARLFRPLDDMYNTEIEELTELLSEPVTFNL